MTHSPARKKVVFVLSGYGKYARGAERIVAQLVLGLSDTFDVSVLGSGKDAPFAIPLEFISRDNVWTHRINRTPGLGHFFRTLQLDPLNWEWLGCALAAKKWLRQNPCDVLITEGGRWGGWLGHWYRKQTGTPFIDIAHGAPSRWEVSAARWRPDCYVAPTQVTAKVMENAVPGLNIRVIPPGVDTRFFANPTSPLKLPLTGPVILSVGALEELKRMDLIIRAVHAMGRGSLLIVGDGPQREALQQLGASLLGPDRFLMRAATRDEMPALYQAADVFVSASRSEAFGLVYIEAMSIGLPVVTQDDPVRREVVGEAGHFVEIPDPVVWAREIESALTNPNRSANQIHAQRFDAGQATRQFREMLDDIMHL